MVCVLPGEVVVPGEVEEAAMNTAPELLKRLYQRQLNMIAIGSVIGRDCSSVPA